MVEGKKKIEFKVFFSIFISNFGISLKRGRRTQMLGRIRVRVKEKKEVKDEKEE